MFDGLLQPTHLILIFIIALLVLGPKRLPEAGRGLGEAIRGFRDSLTAHPQRDEQRQEDRPARTSRDDPPSTG